MRCYDYCALQNWHSFLHANEFHILYVYAEPAEAFCFSVNTPLPLPATSCYPRLYLRTTRHLTTPVGTEDERLDHAIQEYKFRGRS
jgi:hypothetical protein